MPDGRWTNQRVAGDAAALTAGSPSELNSTTTLDERDDDRDGGGDGLTPGHSGCVHLNLTGGLADGWSGMGATRRC